MLSLLRVCSVDYLNSAPLVWGLLHGPQKGAFDLSFRVPSELAGLVASGAVDIGNIPVIEYARQGLTMVKGLGVACRGAVRSILLVSKCPPARIRSLAADTSSRTSVELARIVLDRRYGVQPDFRSHAPDLPAMLDAADAALVIGDPALRIDPAALPFQVVDLGEEWVALTGLPMVFAVWAGRSQFITRDVMEIFAASYRFGREHLDDVIRCESAMRSIPLVLAREYLTRHIVNELGPREYEGLELYLKYAQSTDA